MENGLSGPEVVPGPSRQDVLAGFALLMRLPSDAVVQLNAYFSPEPSDVQRLPYLAHTWLQSRYGGYQERALAEIKWGPEALDREREFRFGMSVMRNLLGEPSSAIAPRSLHLLMTQHPHRAAEVNIAAGAMLQGTLEDVCRRHGLRPELVYAYTRGERVSVEPEEPVTQAAAEAPAVRRSRPTVRPDTGPAMFVQLEPGTARPYMRTVMGHRLLPDAELRPLAGAVQDGRQAAAQLKHEEDAGVRAQLEATVLRGREAAQVIGAHNLKLVTSQAGRFWRGMQGPTGEMYDELIQAGNLGLMEAVGEYKVDTPVAFSTLAVWRIRRAIGRHLLHESQARRLSVPWRESVQLVHRVREEAERVGGSVSAESIGKSVGLPARDVQRLLRGDHFAIDPNQVVVGQGGHGTGGLLDVTDPSSFAPYQSVENTDSAARLWRFLRRFLTEGEQQALYLRNIENLETSEIAERMNVTRVRVHQLEESGTAVARDVMARLERGDPVDRYTRGLRRKAPPEGPLAFLQTLGFQGVEVWDIAYARDRSVRILDAIPLPFRARQLMKLRFGLEPGLGGVPMPLREAARQLGYTPQMARRVQTATTQVVRQELVRRARLRQGGGR
jgi:RNA polymerase sigma factor (sigma-70 family)